MVAKPRQRIEERRQARTIVLLAEVVAGGLEPFGRRKDGARESRVDFSLR